MRGIASALAFALLAGCGRGEQTQQVHAKVNLVPAAPLQAEPAREATPVNSATCEKLAYDSIRNRWWSAFTACESDVEIKVQADSINLGGPDVYITVGTRGCPDGFGHLDRAVFDQPYEAQLAATKQIAKRLLSELEKSCGRPAQAPGLLGRQFDEEFRNLASDWLDMSAAERRKSWGP